MSLHASFAARLGDFKLGAELVIPANGITALYGASGAGKTTLLRAIAGLDRYAGASVKFGEQVWQDQHCFVPTHQRQLGYVFQEASLFMHLNVQGNIEYSLNRVPTNRRNTTLHQTVELFGLQQLLQRMPETLSGGERQRVAIARALAADPAILLMDEPLAGLDRQRKIEILPYIESLHRNLQIPVVYVSHYPNEVARLADHLILLDAGRVIASGQVSEMLTRLDLPLAHDHKSAALIEASVVAHDDYYHLSYLEFAGGQFSVERLQLEVGCSVRLRLAARDVSLTLERPTNTSILNVFDAVVDEIQTEGAAQSIVRLKCGGVPVLARVTRKSVESLRLHVGSKVFVQAKSIAMLG